jgi:hypothetical protein
MDSLVGLGMEISVQWPDMGMGGQGQVPTMRATSFLDHMGHL